MHTATPPKCTLYRTQNYHMTDSRTQTYRGAQLYYRVQFYGEGLEVQHPEAI